VVPSLSIVDQSCCQTCHAPLFAKPLRELVVVTALYKEPCRSLILPIVRCIQWFYFWTQKKKTFGLLKSIASLLKCMRKVSRTRGMCISSIWTPTCCHRGFGRHINENRQFTTDEFYEVSYMLWDPRAHIVEDKHNKWHGSGLSIWTGGWLLWWQIIKPVHCLDTDAWIAMGTMWETKHMLYLVMILQLFGQIKFSFVYNKTVLL
jgi:hypothetical protein